jgi:hypothetical protein
MEVYRKTRPFLPTPHPDSEKRKRGVFSAAKTDKYVVEVELDGTATKRTD